MKLNLKFLEKHFYLDKIRCELVWLIKCNTLKFFPKVNIQLKKIFPLMYIQINKESKEENIEIKYLYQFTSKDPTSSF